MSDPNDESETAARARRGRNILLAVALFRLWVFRPAR